MKKIIEINLFKKKKNQMLNKPVRRTLFFHKTFSTCTCLTHGRYHIPLSLAILPLRGSHSLVTLVVDFSDFSFTRRDDRYTLFSKKRKKIWKIKRCYSLFHFINLIYSFLIDKGQPDNPIKNPRPQLPTPHPPKESLLI